MGKETGIAWTHHTFNPWWGCEKISPGCKNCYAAALDHRMGGEHWGGAAPRRFFEERHWAQPLAWNRAAEKAGERRRVFCASMADVFEDRADLTSTRTRLFLLIKATPHLDWLLLTKRPENLRWLPWRPATMPVAGEKLDWTTRWNAPWPNVWLGTTVEDAHPDRAQRIDQLRQIPAVVRFLSMEPLLERVSPDLTGIDWVIAGCESGAGMRPCSVDWLRSIRDQCAAEAVPFFLKQAKPIDMGVSRIGGMSFPLVDPLIRVGPGSETKRDGVIASPYLDGRQHLEFPTPRAP